MSNDNLIDLRIENIQKEMHESDEGKVDIDGVKYTKVSRRVELFRKHFGLSARLITEVLHTDTESTVMGCNVEIKDEETKEWDKVANAHSQKYKGKSQMAQTSSMEMAETAAIGRALANLGLSGGEFASSNEVSDSKNQGQNEPNQGKNQNSTKTVQKTKHAPSKYQIQKINRSYDEAQVSELLSEHYNVETIAELTKEQASELIKALDKLEQENDISLD